jgi:hypothetical protein
LDQGTLGLAMQVATGVALAACAGLRAFLPVFVVAVAGRVGWIPLSGPFEWLSTTPAILVFGAAVVTEVLSDKIPLLDHLLDMLQGVIKPAAGAMLAMSVVTELDPVQTAVLGIIAGGGTAGVVHVAKAKLRLFSSFTTGGLGNPILSAGEDLLSLGGSLLALVVPVLLIVLVAATLLALFLAVRRFRLRAKALERQ